MELLQDNDTLEELLKPIDSLKELLQPMEQVSQSQALRNLAYGSKPTGQERRVSLG